MCSGATARAGSSATGFFTSLGSGLALAVLGWASVGGTQLTPSASLPKHYEATKADYFYLCASQVKQKVVTATVSAWRALAASSVACPQSAVEFNQAVSEAKAIVLETEWLSYVVLQADFRPSSFGPPRLPWNELEAVVTERAWKGIAESEPLSPETLRSIARTVRLTSRPVPVTGPSDAAVGRMARIEYLVRVDAQRLSRDGPITIIAISAAESDSGRLAVGTLVRGTFIVSWDSPMFSTWMLRLGYSDLDGDGRKEILVGSALGMNGQSTMLSAFTVEGHELTRQDECVSGVRLEDLGGVACGLSGERMEIVPGADGRKDIVVSAEHGQTARFALKGQRYRRP